MKFVPRELGETADISRGSKWSLRYLLKAVPVVVLSIWAVYVLLGWVGELLAASIPDAWEAEMFAFADVGSEPSDPDSRRAERIFHGLVDAGGLRELPYRLFVFEADEPNAVAIPGGKVGITRGLLDLVDSEAGLAMVLAHELGHHQERHALKRLGRTLIFNVVIGLLFGGESISLVESGVNMAEMRYSRAQETAADRFGLERVYQVYGTTDGCFEFFEKVRDLHETDLARWTAFLASHPLTDDRIEYLREVAREIEAGGE